MDILLVAFGLRRAFPKPPATLDAEDRYYRSHVLPNRRGFPFVPVAALVGIAMLILNVAGR